MKYDVIIIGAGPGGIFSAYELAKKRPDLKVAVFEAPKKSISSTLRLPLFAIRKSTAAFAVSKFMDSRLEWYAPSSAKQ